MKNWYRIILITIAVLVVDLTTKHFLFDVEYKNIIPKVISFASNGGNSGAAFGIFSGNATVLAVVSIGMIVGLFLFNHYVKKKTWLYCISFAFVLGGAIGNLVDRICFSYVRDFIYLDFLPEFPIFNFADSFLVIGAILLVVFILFFSGKKDENK